MQHWSEKNRLSSNSDWAGIRERKENAVERLEKHRLLASVIGKTDVFVWEEEEEDEEKGSGKVLKVEQREKKGVFYVT